MLRCGLLLAILALPTAARAAAWAATLMAGGFNLQLRHAIMGRRQHDTGRLLDHRGPRNLSEAGRAEVLAIGAGIRRSGITFATYTEEGDPKRLIPFDVIPRILSKSEWERLSAGLVQRVKALNAVLTDVYGPAASSRPG
jgi:hypothetical protein